MLHISGKTRFCQILAAEPEAFQSAQHGNSEFFGVEEFLGEGSDFFGRHRFDLLQDFVDGEEAAKVQFLPREVGHAAGG